MVGSNKPTREQRAVYAERTKTGKYVASKDDRKNAKDRIKREDGKKK